VIVWYCTRRFLQVIGTKPTEEPGRATTTLGDWHANVADTRAGRLLVFANNKTFIPIGIPFSEVKHVEELFVARLGNLLGLLGIAWPAIEREMRATLPIQYARASDRSRLGHLQSIVYQFQAIAEDQRGQGPLSLSDAEVEVANMPHLGSFQAIPSDALHQLFEVGD
jgi:hypothetical protein